MSKATAGKRDDAERPPRKPAPRKASGRQQETAAQPPPATRNAANRTLKSAVQARSGIERNATQPPDEASPMSIGKGRKGRKAIVVYLHPAAKDLLDLIALKKRRTVQDLGLEAVNLLFRSYGEKPIA